MKAVPNLRLRPPQEISAAHLTYKVSTGTLCFRNWFPLDDFSEVCVGLVCGQSYIWFCFLPLRGWVVSRSIWPPPAPPDWSSPSSPLLLLLRLWSLSLGHSHQLRPLCPSRIKLRGSDKVVGLRETKTGLRHLPLITSPLLPPPLFLHSSSQLHPSPSPPQSSLLHPSQLRHRCILFLNWFPSSRTSAHRTTSTSPCCGSRSSSSTVEELGGKRGWRYPPLGRTNLQLLFSLLHSAQFLLHLPLLTSTVVPHLTAAPLLSHQLVSTLNQSLNLNPPSLQSQRNSNPSLKPALLETLCRRKQSNYQLHHPKLLFCRRLTSPTQIVEGWAWLVWLFDLNTLL